MKYLLNETELREMAEFEDEVGHSLSVGLDWGDRVGDFFRQAHESIDFDKLEKMLSESSVGEILTDLEIQALTQNFKKEIAQTIKTKLEDESKIS